MSFTEVEGLAELGAGRTHRIKNVKVTAFPPSIISPCQLLGYRPYPSQQGVC